MGGAVNLGVLRGKLPSLCGILFLSFATVSCGGPPQYDDKADTQLTDLQKEVDSQIVQLISWQHQHDSASLKKASYAQNVDWYNKVDTDTMALELRMEAVSDPSTANLPQFFDNLRTQFTNIKTSHAADTNLEEEIWIVLRSQLNVQYATLITYELSLKGVSSASSSSTKSTSTTNATAKAGKPGK